MPTVARNTPQTTRRVFLDTSVLVRFLTRDDEKKYESCRALIALTEAGALRPYVSNVVVLELVYVLGKLYRRGAAEVHRDLARLLALRNATLIERTDTVAALNLWERHGIKYADCLIATQVPEGVVLVTYDADFAKIAKLSTATPEDIVPHDSQQ